MAACPVLGDLERLLERCQCLARAAALAECGYFSSA
jgi:hypothetical protein